MIILQVKSLNELQTNAGFWDNFIWPLCVVLVIAVASFFHKKITSLFSKKEIILQTNKEKPQIKFEEPLQENSIKVLDNKNSSIHIGNSVVYNYNVEKEKEREKGNLNISDFEATRVSEIINQSPPFQKKQTASNYKGIRIKWEVNLQNVQEPDGNIARVMTLYKNNYPWVNFSIDLENYPTFKVANLGEKFILTGTIIKTDGATYEIEVETIE